MRKLLLFLILGTLILKASAQDTISIEKCHELALQNNRQLQISKLTKEVAENTYKVAKTKYLPRVNGLASYEHFSKEISLLNNEQKNILSNLGTNSIGHLGSAIENNLTSLAKQGIISSNTASHLKQVLGGVTTPLSQVGDNIGNQIKEAFRTDTRNIYNAGIIFSQPIYMGGAIKAANDMAAIGKSVASNTMELKRQMILYAVDNAYWLAVSLKKKEMLATKYKDLAKKLSDDVQKMIKEGVATKADGLKVAVVVNTAELQISQIQSIEAIAKMALCELCGIALNSDLILKDEQAQSIAPLENIEETTPSASAICAQRPELRLLQNTIDLSKQNTKIIKSLYLPHILLTGGYSVMNPNLFNGFQNKFTDLWNIGIVVHVPIWNWEEGKYKIRATKAATNIANLELQDAIQKINLEIEQYQLRLKCAKKQLNTAKKNLQAAEENLRCANIGFKEGVMTVIEVMLAQTAWQTAKTAIIDSEIAVRLAQTGLQKALGTIDN